LTVIGLSLSGNPANTDLQLLVCLLAENQQIQIYSYWFAPERKKPANTDLQLLVYPLAKKPSKYRFTVIGLPLSEKTQQIQIYSYWFTP
jgi:hypothetical protein